MKRYFASQLESENICLVIRQHWIILFFKLFTLVFCTLLGIGLYIAAKQLLPVAVMEKWLFLLHTSLIVFLAAMWLGLLLITLRYYLHLQIITNIRLVDVDQVGLLRRRENELGLENVQDVTSEVKGLFQTIFNYGSVVVQTSGAAQRNFDFDLVSHPEQVKKLILDLYEKHRDHNH